VATRDVFTDEELDQLRRFPDISREELIRYFTLTPADEAFVVARHGAANRLGAAVQLCSLPWLGFVPDDVVSAPPVAVARLSERLRIPVGELVDYGSREQTRTDHLREVARYLGWRLAEEFQWRELDEFLFARAMEHDPPKLLFRLGCEYLASSRVIRPGVVTVLLRVAAACRLPRSIDGTDSPRYLALERRVSGLWLRAPVQAAGRRGPSARPGELLERARACCSIPATRTTSRPSAPHHPDHRRQLPTDRATHDQVARVMEIKQLDTLDPDVIHAARQMLVVGIH